MARQVAAERAGAAITRFYKNCRQKKSGKKGYPRFQKDCRSVEYKTSGWKLDEMRWHLTLTDGLEAGTFKLKGTRTLLGYALGAIKRVRLLRRADGYYAQFAIDADRHVTVKPSGTAIGIDLGLTQFYNAAVTILSKGVALLAHATVGHHGKSRLGRDLYYGSGRLRCASPLAEPRIPAALALGVSNRRKRQGGWTEAVARKAQGFGRAVRRSMGNR